VFLTPNVSQVRSHASGQSRAAALAELTELAAGSSDLLSECAGIAIGFHEGDLDEAQYLSASKLARIRAPSRAGSPKAGAEPRQPEHAIDPASIRPSIRPHCRIAPFLDQGGSAALRRNGAARTALWLEAPRARARPPWVRSALTMPDIYGTLSTQPEAHPSRARSSGSRPHRQGRLRRRTRSANAEP
jgi:hypothetical protein